MIASFEDIDITLPEYQVKDDLQFEILSMVNGRPHVEILHNHPIYHWFKDPYNWVTDKDTIINNKIVFKVSIQDDHDGYFRNYIHRFYENRGWKIYSTKYEDDDKIKRQKTYRAKFIGKHFVHPRSEYLVEHIRTNYLN